MDPESPFHPYPPLVSAVLRGERPTPYADDGGDRCYAPDIGRLTADTGFTPAFDLRAAFADYVAWRGTHPR